MTEPEDMILWMDKRLWSLHTYLEDHGPGSKNPRPQHVIEGKQQDIAMFEELRRAYTRALENRRAQA